MERRDSGGAEKPSEVLGACSRERRSKTRFSARFICPAISWEQRNRCTPPPPTASSQRSTQRIVLFVTTIAHASARLFAD